MYLLDTNSCIDFALARSELLRDRISEAYPRGLAISAITLAELRVGAKHSGAEPDDNERLDNFVRALTFHEFDSSAAQAYGALARTICVKRRSFDRLIAAHAVALNLIVVTNNPKHFADVPGLKVENWTV